MRILTSDVNPRETRNLTGGGSTLPIVLAAIGIVALGIAAILGSLPNFLRAWLVNLGFTLSIALGAIFFVLLQHVTGSTWSVVVRRIAEATAKSVGLLGLLFIPIVAGLNVVYGWTHVHPADPLPDRGIWYAPAFFVIRMAIYFGVWIVISRWFFRTSVAQDESGDPRLTLRMQARAPLGLVLYGMTLAFASYDVFMSLDPRWTSTIFGAYIFGGAVVAFFAFLILAVFLLNRAGKLRDEITIEHYHDLGKQLFGWTVFWAYIAFSQYMLIWYGNMPEETEWYFTRFSGGWALISWALLIGAFALPFFLLLPRKAKRTPAFLAAVAALVLLMHWVDVFWLVAPMKSSLGVVSFSGVEVACFIGHVALFLAAIAWSLRSASLLPERDPRLPESLAFENV